MLEREECAPEGGGDICWVGGPSSLPCWGCLVTTEDQALFLVGKRSWWLIVLTASPGGPESRFPATAPLPVPFPSCHLTWALPRLR